MYLEKLSLHNYRGIRDMEIEFDRHLNVFVGDNGCGKTTIIDAIERCVRGSLINQVTGDERLGCLLTLSIDSWRILNKQAHAKNILNFVLSEQTVEVVSSSFQDEISSSLGNQLGRIDAIDFSVFPASRQSVAESSKIYSDEDNENSPEENAFAWIKALEDEENSEFRWHVDEGNDPSSFVLNSKLQAIKQVVAKLAELERIQFDNRAGLFKVVKSGNGEQYKFNLHQLSLGELVRLGLVLAIACGVIKAATDENDLLGAEHLIIIDEIDLHLHPKWQRRIVPALRETFPNCQFIITTHSPQVLSEVPAENIFSLYRDENGDIQYEKPDMSKGLSSSEILEEVMDLPSYSPEFEKALSEIYSLIEDEKFDAARKLIEDHEKELGEEVPALVKARTVLDLSE